VSLPDTTPGPTTTIPFLCTAYITHTRIQMARAEACPAVITCLALFTSPLSCSIFSLHVSLVLFILPFLEDVWMGRSVVLEDDGPSIIDMDGK